MRKTESKIKKVTATREQRINAQRIAWRKWLKQYRTNDMVWPFYSWLEDKPVLANKAVVDWERAQEQAGELAETIRRKAKAQPAVPTLVEQIDGLITYWLNQNEDKFPWALNNVDRLEQFRRGFYKPEAKTATVSCDCNNVGELVDALENTLPQFGVHITSHPAWDGNSDWGLILSDRELTKAEVDEIGNELDDQEMNNLGK